MNPPPTQPITSPSPHQTPTMENLVDQTTTEAKCGCTRAQLTAFLEEINTGSPANMHQRPEAMSDQNTCGNHACLQALQMQLDILEQSNKRRLIQARREQDAFESRAGETGRHSATDYSIRLRSSKQARSQLQRYIDRCQRR